MIIFAYFTIICLWNTLYDLRRGLGFDQSSSSISSVNMLDPLQRNLARSLQLQQRAAKRREQEEAQADSSSSEEEELRPAARVSASPSSSGKGKIKKVMRKGDQMMFYQGAHQTKAMKKLLKKQQAAQKNKTSSPAKAATWTQEKFRGGLWFFHFFNFNIAVCEQKRMDGGYCGE